MTGNRKERIIYLLATIVFFSVETMIALYIHDRYIRPFVGDILVVILVYCFIRIFFPSGIRLLSLYTFLFACLVEYMQYLHIIETLGLAGNAIARTVIGTSFDWRDILCYAAGCLILEGIRHSAVRCNNPRSR
jgi:hypothetical protein